MSRHDPNCSEADNSAIRHCSTKVFKWATSTIRLCRKCEGKELANGAELRAHTCWAFICAGCVHNLAELIKTYRPKPKVCSLDTTKSTAIRSIRWIGNQLYVEFTSGGFYRYDEVPEITYTLFCQAPSKGRFFHNHIKGSFHGIKVPAKEVEGIKFVSYLDIKNDPEELYLQDYIEGVI